MAVQFLFGIIVLAAAAIAAVVICNIIVQQSSSGKTFDDIEEMPEREYGVLLGTNPLNRFGRRNQFYHYRIEAAKRLYRHGKVKHFIISGSQCGDTYNEPAAMRDELVSAGIPESVIQLDGEGDNTLLSVKNARAVTGCVAFISQKSHNQRAIYYARHSGLDAIGFNAFSPIGPRALRVYAREALARVKAVVNVVFHKSMLRAGFGARL